jgi:hypothetical protein
VTIDPEITEMETTGGSNSPDALLPDSTQNGTVTTENDNSDDDKKSPLDAYSIGSDSTIIP